MAASRHLIDLFERSVDRRPLRAMLRAWTPKGWRSESFARWRARSDAVARGLLALGLNLGDRVVLMAETSPDWVRADMAIFKAGGVSVPIYPSHLAEHVRHIAQDSGARFMLVDDPAQIEKLLDGEVSDALEWIIYMEPKGAAQQPNGEQPPSATWRERVQGAGLKALELSEVITRGLALDRGVLTQLRAEVRGGDPCSFVYTSGTEGSPKGVVLTHEALVFQVNALLKVLDLRDDDSVLLFMPLAHILPRVVYLVCIARGLEMVFPSGRGDIFDQIGEASPTIVPTVPRVLERLRALTRAESRRGGFIARYSMRWAVSIGKEIHALRHSKQEVGSPLSLGGMIADKMVFSRLRERLGGRVRCFISGGAPLSTEVSLFFEAFGYPVFEGYGMTENTAVATLNYPPNFRQGTVGRPLPGVQLRLAADGEVLVAGPNLMQGYHGRPRDTAAVFLEEQGQRWLRTGDIGEIDVDGFLSITDRKRDVIVTSAGKTVSPQTIERHFENHDLISRVMIHGDRRPFLTALLTLDEGELRLWAQDKGLTWTDYASLTRHPDVFQQVEQIVDAKNRALASYETVKKFAILERDFRRDEGDLTPTLKVRRGAVSLRHETLLDSFYEEAY